ncbi:hypothetical protein M758_6G062200 [Ceratodon purpureus]|nr:hypothetical protein M758_6G062200 [Ceratodon purpureus]
MHCLWWLPTSLSAGSALLLAVGTRPQLGICCPPLVRCSSPNLSAWRCNDTPSALLQIM